MRIYFLHTHTSWTPGASYQHHQSHLSQHNWFVVLLANLPLPNFKRFFYSLYSLFINYAIMYQMRMERFWVRFQVIFIYLNQLRKCYCSHTMLQAYCCCCCCCLFDECTGRVNLLIEYKHIFFILIVSECYFSHFDIDYKWFDGSKYNYLFRIVFFFYLIFFSFISICFSSEKRRISVNVEKRVSRRAACLLFSIMGIKITSN